MSEISLLERHKDRADEFMCGKATSRRGRFEQSGTECSDRGGGSLIMVTPWEITQRKQGVRKR